MKKRKCRISVSARLVVIWISQMLVKPMSDEFLQGKVKETVNGTQTIYTILLIHNSSTNEPTICFLSVSESLSMVLEFLNMRTT